MIRLDEVEVRVLDRLWRQTEPFKTLSRFELHPRLNGIGTWLLECDARERAALNVIEGTGIAVLVLGVVVFSGPATLIERSEGEEGPRLFVSGIDDTGRLGDHWASPVPAGPPYTSADQDRLTNTAAETALHHYVGANCGPSAPIQTRITGLVMGTDGGRGGTLDAVHARFDNLLDLCQRIAISGGGLRFRILADLAAGMTFSVHPPDDRRATVVFARVRGNLDGVVRRLVAPSATHVVAAGKGEGTAREFYETFDSHETWKWNRIIRRFRDARGANSTDELIQHAAEDLAAGKSQEVITFEPVTTAATEWLTHYDLGDRVSVIADGVTIEGYVSEVGIKAQGNALTIAPIITTTALGAASGGWQGALSTNRGYSPQNAALVSLAANVEGFTRGMGMLWLDSNVSRVPSGWAICNGTGGTPDLRGRFVVGAGGTYALGDTGGAASVDLAHTHTVDIDHAHTVSMGGPLGVDGAPGGVTDVNGTGTRTVADDVHEHVATATALGSTNVTSSAAGSATQSILPPYYAAYYIVRTV